MAKWESLPNVSKFFASKLCVYQTEIHRTMLRQPIRIEYLIKHKPRGALAEK